MPTKENMHRVFEKILQVTSSFDHNSHNQNTINNNKPKKIYNDQILRGAQKNQIQEKIFNFYF